MNTRTGKAGIRQRRCPDMMGQVTVKNIFSTDPIQNIHTGILRIDQRLHQGEPGTVVVRISNRPGKLSHISAFVEGSQRHFSQTFLSIRQLDFSTTTDPVTSPSQLSTAEMPSIKRSGGSATDSSRISSLIRISGAFKSRDIPSQNRKPTNAQTAQSGSIKTKIFFHTNASLSLEPLRLMKSNFTIFQNQTGILKKQPLRCIF